MTSVTEDGAPKSVAPGTRVELHLARQGGPRDFIGWGAVYESGEEQAGESARNGGTSRLKITPDQLVVADGYSHHDEGCGLAEARQDEWLAAFFTSDPSWALSDELLVLSSGDMQMRLVEGAPPR